MAEVIELFQAVPDPDSELLDDPLQRVWSETAGRCLADWEQLTIAELARRTAGQWDSSACSEAGVHPSPKSNTHEGKENSSAAAEAQRRPEEEETGKKRVAGFLACFFVLLLTAMTAKAGEIVGTLGVPKPDQAVVYVEKVPGTFPGGHAKMGQKNKVFQPYVLPVVRGTTVQFLNGDDLQHNVFGVGADEFNLGSFGKGGVREHTFNKEGQVAVLCNVHPEMEAYILVLDNPYFAQADASGKFRIANVPPGTYVIKAWYNAKTRKQTVTVPATGAVTVTF